MGIALWDVAHQCVCLGSLDTNIYDVKVNNFNAFFATHQHIHAIFFNGRKAAALYRQLVLPELGSRWRELPQTYLPSTSPAHAARSFAEKLAAWQTVRQALETHCL